jgi:hypothetical protein
MTQPNVFIVQIQRRLGAPRVPIAVEEQLELPGWSPMDLVGVIYHDGPTPDSGHYTCACRLADGRYSLFDDNSSAVALTDEVGHVNQRLATLAVYCRLGGSFECTSSAAAAAATSASVGISVNDGVAIDGIAPSTASGSVGAAVAPPQLGASDAFAGERPLLRRLSRKTSATSDPSKTSVSAVLPAISLPEVTAPRRSLKRNSTVAGLTEYVDSNTVSVHSVAAASPRRRILGKTPSRDVAGSAHILCGDSSMAPGVFDVAAELPESSGPVMSPRLLRRRSSDLSERVLDRWLSRAMETTSDEELRVATACDHSVAGDVSTVSVASEPPVVVSSDEVWRRFTPIVIDPVKCLARTFNGGAGGQCKRNPQAGGVTCGACKKLAHGRVDGPIPDGKLQVFLRSGRGL